MKTQATLTQKRTFNTMGVLMTLLFASLALSPVHAQTEKVASTEVSQEGRTIKGIISNAEGPLESASIVLKGTSTGTTTDAKGEFTFPKPLHTGDVLLISYLGYETQTVPIKDSTTFIRLQLTEDLIEFIGALNTDTPYKSKHSKE
ncbi:MAG: carboxypeptidase-like regulatory domain-containing protein [Gelidibacter sp.]